jgi:hypothetical protein
MGIIWTIIIGFLAGLIARWIHPGVFQRALGLCPDDTSGHCRGIRRHFPGASNRLVSCWRRCRAHRSRGWRGNSACHMGRVRKPHSKGLMELCLDNVRVELKRNLKHVSKRTML